MYFFERSIDGSQSFSSPSLFSLVLINSDKHVASPASFFVTVYCPHWRVWNYQLTGSPF